MINQSIALYDWANGVMMIGIFALVVVVLAMVPILLMKSDKKKKEE